MEIVVPSFGQVISVVLLGLVSHKGAVSMGIVAPRSTQTTSLVWLRLYHSGLEVLTHRNPYFFIEQVFSFDGFVKFSASNFQYIKFSLTKKNNMSRTFSFPGITKQVIFFYINSQTFYRVPVRSIP